MLNPSNEEPFDSSDRLSFDLDASAKRSADEPKRSAEPMRKPAAPAKGIVRIGKGRPGDPAGNLRMSSKSGDPADAIYSEIAALKASLQEAQTRAADEATERRLQELSGQLGAITKSVEFTEAYVTVGLATRMADLIRQELSSAETQLARLATARFRLLVVGSIAMILAVLLGVEIATDGVSITAAKVTAQVDRMVPLQDDVGALLRGLRE